VNCVFCCQLKGAEKSVLGGIMNFRRPGWRPTKIHAQLFSSATDRPTKINTIYFRGPPPGPTKIAFVFSSATERPTKIVSRLTIFVGLGEADEYRLFSSVPTEIVAYFRRTYFRGLFSSV
jgi:hypothetical protein